MHNNLSVQNASDKPATDNTRGKRCAVVGIVGRTNSGKSTLLNTLVGEKVTIVSSTVQTTRNTVRAFLTRKNTQLVFLDTPGLHKSESTLGTLMNRMARSSAAGVDILMIVFDASHKPRLEDEGWMTKALKCAETQPIIMVLNKSDMNSFDPQPFIHMWNNLNNANPEQSQPEQNQIEWIECSAIKKKSCNQLLDWLTELAPPTDEYLFPPEIVTDYPRKLAIADIIREKYLPKLRDEIPHEIGIFVENINENNNLWDVDAIIYVNKPMQKGIIIGAKGSLLKWVRKKAEKELTEIYDTKIRLNLWVKVEKNWFKNSNLLEQMGYIGQF